MSRYASTNSAWAGARWWRFDFHVHTPASHDAFNDVEVTAEQWVEAARSAGLDAVVVTDHNGADFIDRAQAAAPEDLVIFPGVELTTSEGAHLLVVFDESASANEVRALLATTKIPTAEWGSPTAQAKKSFIECLELATEAGGLCIAAHADKPPGDGRRPTSLWECLAAGEPRNAVLNSELLVAAEVHTEDEERAEALRSFPYGDRVRALVRGSDAHRLGDIGAAYTWIKATRPTLEGLRLALGDGEASVRVGGLDPNAERPAASLRSISIANAKLAGRPAPLTLQLSPWLNALIGGRGTGKSSIIEFARLCLGQDAGLPEAAHRSFQDFAREPEGRQAKGALQPDTEVTVEYEKSGTRYRVCWENRSRTIERLNDGSWHPESGDVAERFPAQIFSQKQIYELAEQPQALLTVIDRAPSVDRAGWAAEWSQLESAYLVRRARARELSAGIAEADRLDGQLADLNNRIAAIESGQYQTVLREVTQVAEQRTALLEFAEGLTRFAGEINDLANASPPGLDPRPFPTSIEPHTSLVGSAAILDEVKAGVAEELRDLGHRLSAAVEAWIASPSSAAWRLQKAQTDQAKAALERELADQGIGNPAEHDQLLTRRDEVRAQLKNIQSQREELKQVQADAETALERLLESRERLTKRRQDFVASVLEENPHVQMTVSEMGDQEAAEKSLRDVLNIGGTQSYVADITGTADAPGLIRRIYSSTPGSLADELAKLRGQLASCAEGSEPAWPIRDRRFIRVLRDLKPEALDRLRYWHPSDSVDVRYSRKGNGDKFEPLTQGSPGQKTAAILAFLLAHGDEPIVLDQPEDDLDTSLIYELIVNQLRLSKSRRQIIVATHNPNIVVNGDAEHVAVIDFIAGQTNFRCTGGLQEAAVRQQICAVMEGGKTAFERRYNRIAPHAI